MVETRSIVRIKEYRTLVMLTSKNGGQDTERRTKQRTTITWWGKCKRVWTLIKAQNVVQTRKQRSFGGVNAQESGR